MGPQLPPSSGGLLRGGNPGAATRYAESITREFLWLFGWNVAVSLIAVGADTLRSVNTPMEITAFVAIVVATRGVMLWHQESVPRGRGEFVRVRSPGDRSLTRREWVLLVGGYLLLAVACHREAVAIARVAG